MKKYFILKGVEGNLLKYTVALVTHKRLFVAILGAYYLTIPDVTPWWVGTILFASTLSGFLFEIPSGYIADKIGHKKALVVSSVSLVLSTSFFLLAESIPFLFLGGILLSIGFAFISGTGTAFVHETLRALGRESEFREIMGKMKSIGFAIPIILTTLIPFLVSISWHLPFAIALVSDLMGLIAVCSLVTPPVPQEHIDEIRLSNFKQVMHEAYKINFFRYAIFSGILAGILFGVGGFRAVYQSTLGIPVVWFGVLFGIGRGIASLLLWHSGRIQRLFKTPTQIYTVKLVVFTFLIIVLGLTQNVWGIAVIFIFINAFEWGSSNIGYSVEATGKSKFKATLLSVKSQIQMLVGGGSAFLLGYLIEIIGYQKSFLVLALILVCLLTPLLYMIAKDKKRIGVGGEDSGSGE
ncbi:MAG: MFS transporter [Candidatus Kaiserbacteria bacterium]|nr:MFS transporter [Candidatus Kaiserbacteria bacterium]